MFKRLMQALGGKPDSSPRLSDPAHDAPGEGEEGHPQLITVYDAHGRELQVTRADWRDRMLLPQLQAKRDQPDALYQLILQAISDGFLADVESASIHLMDIDPNVERGHVLRAIVLMGKERWDEAERVLRNAIAKVGETGTVLTNLAKIQVGRGDSPQADATLWRAITLDPNQDNGLGWWLARERERGGDAGYEAALQKAMALPGSWRAWLHLGRQRFADGDIPAGLVAFRAVLESAGDDSEVLATISGDLGNAGQIAELVSCTEPYYVPERHDPKVGMNLVQAYLHLDRLKQAEALLNRLYALDVPPIRQHLDMFQTRLQESLLAAESAQPIDTEGLEIIHMPFDRPIWQYGLRDPQWLFAPKSVAARKVTFLMLSKVVSGDEQAERQREDDVGRLSRAIPLYLAESAYQWTDLQAHSLAAVVKGGGPVLFGAQGEAGERSAAEQLASSTDLLVVGSIGQVGDIWTIDLGIWDSARTELVGRESISAGPAALHAAVLDLESKVLARLGGLRSAPHDAIYARPTPEQMSPYLDALAQSFSLCLAANGVTSKESMWGERNMIEWPLRMLLQWPEREVFQVMYISGISHAGRYRSTLLDAFDTRSFALLDEIRQRDPVLAGLGPLLLKAYGWNDELKAQQLQTTDVQRLEWMQRVME
ncbi:tetratricopeptide repeat protein [Stenotrophomonas bentonitica]|uniref:tetratricopeptide repeat protein n=1 Tax=Stenotrophomonas bentonitica TaxID=1450134 RepID=UPI00345E100F